MPPILSSDFLCIITIILVYSDHDESIADKFFYFQSSQVQVTAISECVYPRSPAMALGLTSALSLMIAQIIINVSTGCICCKRNPHPSNSNWTVALICFVVSWYVSFTTC